MLTNTLDELPPIPTELAAVSTPELRAELVKGLTLSAYTLTRLAVVWSELERRGEDLSDLRRGLAATLPLIASGRLAAEAVVAFAGRPTLMRCVTGLPLDQQREIANGQPVPLAVPKKNGEYMIRQLPIGSLNAGQIRQIFGDAGIRDLDEQAAVIEARKVPGRRRNKPDTGDERKYRVRVEDGHVHVGRMTIPVADLAAAMAESVGPLPVIGVDAADTETASVRLTQTEKQKLRVAEKRRGLPEWHLIREALHAYGLI